MKKMLRTLCLLLCTTSVFAQKYELRGVWLATVGGLDWPKSRGANLVDMNNQKASLVAMFDKFQQAGLNAVFFHARPVSDALYNSTYEPWSTYLTGTQGLAPYQSWDPLQFAIEEAHKRGMELHAWINPYRAISSSTGTVHSSHVSAENPSWMAKQCATANPTVCEGTTYTNPGIPAARNYIIDVAMDIVNRYNVDGLHYDDYFYPYPATGYEFQDEASYQTYGAGTFNNKGNWRRFSVNMFVRDLNTRIIAAKPFVKHGVSPFGIWKSGTPSGISGLSSFDAIYCDPVAWLDNKWVDYITPQLYWNFGGSQDYAKLAPWWANQARKNGRHFYPGLASYRADVNTVGNATLFNATVVPNQIRFNRARPDSIQGNLLFRAQNISDYYSGAIFDTLKAKLNARPALTPTMAWKDQTAPNPPTNVSYTTLANGAKISWTAATPATGANGLQVPARFYAVYRVQSSVAPNWAVATANPQNLLTITAQTEFTDTTKAPWVDYFYYVASVSPNSVESATGGIVTDVTSEEVPDELSISPNYPNPFYDKTSIEFSLPENGAVKLTLFDILGREIETVFEGYQDAGKQGIDVNASKFAAGTYLLVLQMGDKKVSRIITKM
jgi:uncharacterized lipoprotein YddW (UPF0748 family)